MVYFFHLQREHHLTYDQQHPCSALYLHTTQSTAGFYGHGKDVGAWQRLETTSCDAGNKKAPEEEWKMGAPFYFTLITLWIWVVTLSITESNQN